ncbi:MAG TPA: thiamine pyrophosphate-dependent enzyme [Candidatus Entotheonella sp.]
MHRANAEYLERLYQQYLANPHALEARWHAFFKQGVLLDLWCYRRHGHHETDDSMFTQPCMYEEIAAHASVCQLYAQRLAERGVTAPDEVEQTRQTVRQQLETAHEVARELRPCQRIFTLGGLWTGLTRAGDDWDAKTAVGSDELQRVGDGATRVPPGFEKRLWSSPSAPSISEQSAVKNKRLWHKTCWLQWGKMTRIASSHWQPFGETRCLCRLIK